MLDFLSQNLIPLLTVLGVGAILGKVVDSLINGRRTRVEVDNVVIEGMKEELIRLRNLISGLQAEMDELRVKLRLVEDESHGYQNTLRLRDGYYWKTVKLADEEPDETLRPELKNVLEDMRPLVTGG